MQQETLMTVTNNRPAGFASGAFRALEIGIEEAMKWNKKAGATAFEITFGTLQEIADFFINPAILRMRKELSHFSIHLPFKGLTQYDKAFCSQFLSVLKPLSDVLLPDAAVVHVELIQSWEPLIFLKETLKIPIAVENADCRKNIQTDIPLLLEGADLGFNLVFDIAHARSRISEQGENPLLWTGLLEKGKPLARCLSHIHASMNTPGGSHTCLSGHPQSNEVIDFLNSGVLTHKPVILEGPLMEATLKNLAAELEGLQL